VIQGQDIGKEKGKKKKDKVQLEIPGKKRESRLREDGNKRKQISCSLFSLSYA